MSFFNLSTAVDGPMSFFNLSTAVADQCLFLTLVRLWWTNVFF